MQAKANGLLSFAIDMVKQVVPDVPADKIKPDVRLFESATTWGQCRQYGDQFIISLNSHLLELEKVDPALETLLHEILHTIRGCWNHGPKWKRLAGQLNSRYGCDIKTTATASEKGANAVIAKHFKYYIQCKKCGEQHGLQRRTKAYKQPELYTHTGCGGTFERVE